jgi:hypothetical protein
MTQRELQNDVENSAAKDSLKKNQHKRHDIVHSINPFCTQDCLPANLLNLFLKVIMLHPLSLHMHSHYLQTESVVFDRQIELIQDNVQHGDKILHSIIGTEHRSQMVSILASYSGGTRFKSQRENWLS